MRQEGGSPGDKLWEGTAFMLTRGLEVAVSQDYARQEATASLHEPAMYRISCGVPYNPPCSAASADVPQLVSVQLIALQGVVKSLGSSWSIYAGKDSDISRYL